MAYNSSIHHRRSIRLKGYDYSQAGLYFITICIQDRKCLFGKIANDEMILNNAGTIANECWLEIPKHFPNSVLHEHIVMPNHVHGIIELIQGGVSDVGAENFLPLQSDTVPIAGIENFQSIPPPNESLPKESKRNEIQKMIPHSIGSIVKGFKIGVTKWFRNNSGIVRSENVGTENVRVENFQPEPEKIWQRNYHEHIIRDEQSYQRISEYIINNPKNWKEDKFYLSS